MRRTGAGGLLPYLDMPFQHASPRILRADEAARRHPRKCSTASARGARAVPTSRCAARSSSAFPARPKPNSTSCSRFLDEAQLDRVGCFAYSPVDGAAANALPDPVPEAVKEERRARFMAAAGGDQRGAAAGEGRHRRSTCSSTRRRRRRRSRARRPTRRRSTASCGLPTAAPAYAGSVRARARHVGGRARPAREARVKVGSDSTFPVAVPRRDAMR